ncbi:MAG: phasin family protein [Alphaproteobacteria bacterium]
MSKTSTQFDKIIKDTQEFGTQYSDACAKSGEIFVKGMEDMMSTMISLTQQSAAKQSDFVKQAMSSKTINEFAETQNKIAKENFDDFVSGANKMSEIGVKILTESSDPVSKEVSKAVQKATKSMAA